MAWSQLTASPVPLGDESANVAAPQNTSTNGGIYLSEDRNLLMNGDFRIDQANEGASVSLVSGTASYVTDGWGVKLLQSSVTASAQRVADAPLGFLNSLKITVTTGNAVGAGDYLIVEAPVEGLVTQPLGYGAIGAANTSLGFWIKSSVAAQTFSFALQNSSRARTYVGSFVINSAATWTFVPFTSLIGDITGTWLTTNGIGAYLFISVASGSTNQTSTLNAWQASSSFAANTQTNAILTTNGATFQIATAQWELGSNCTPFARRRPEVEKLICTRQYQKTFPDGTAPAQNAGVTGAITVKNPIALGDPSEWWQLAPKMIATPTFTTYNPSATNANWRDITASSDATVSVDPATTKGPTGVLIATSGTVTTLGDVLAIHAVADARLTLF